MYPIFSSEQPKLDVFTPKSEHAKQNKQKVWGTGLVV